MTVPVPPSFSSVSLSLEKLAACLLNASGLEPLPARFRAIFALKNIGSENAIQILGEAFSDNSALLKHELAYVLGQIGNPVANPILSKVLADETQNEMVRHEAAEALGAIASNESLFILQKFLDDPSESVRETCEISIERIRKNEFREKLLPEEIIFGSIDPAPSLKEALSIDSLQNILMNKSLSLYERYKAMFALRNRAQDSAAILALCSGFGDESALFRHEIAYVLGQLQHPASIPSLGAVLRSTSEVPMVRHECAEALGSIATPECLAILKEFENDSEDVVRESCKVALDMYEYENSDELQFFPLD